MQEISIYRKLMVFFMAGCLLAFSGCKKDEDAPTPIKTNFAILSAAARTVVAASNNSAIPFKNMLGVDSYAWDFLQNPQAKSDVSKIFEPKMQMINSFSAVRQYLLWAFLEYQQGNYTFNPSHDGSWNFDIINQRCKQDGIVMLADIKDQPNWMMYTYPSSEWNTQNIPMPFRSDPTLPSSYIMQGKVAFQYAARYGSNANVNRKLLSVASYIRWTNDPANQVKVGLNTINYMECDNERDKWWFGAPAKQTPQEYAANMSAFYDGDQGRLGKNVGVKNADPNIKVVMGGLATANIAYVQAMIQWCKVHRGYKANGSVDLCFDVINYHYYANDHKPGTNDMGTVGVAPELNEGGTVADGFVKLAQSLPQHPEVWVTEAGYDINAKSTQRAIAIGKKSNLVTQADWNLRTALMYMRHGINRLFFYQLFDDLPNGPITFQTSGMVNTDLSHRPAFNYIAQVSQLLGSYVFAGTINNNPNVDKYTSGSSTMYSLLIPDQKGRTAEYKLDLGTATKADIYTLNAYSTTITKTTVPTYSGKVDINVTETPVFVQPHN